MTKLRLPTGDAPPQRVYASHYDPAIVEMHFEPLLKSVRHPTPEERWAQKTLVPFVWKG